MAARVQYIRGEASIKSFFPIWLSQTDVASTHCCPDDLNRGPPRNSCFHGPPQRNRNQFKDQAKAVVFHHDLELVALYIGEYLKLSTLTMSHDPRAIHAASNMHPCLMNRTYSRVWLTYRARNNSISKRSNSFSKTFAAVTNFFTRGQGLPPSGSCGLRDRPVGSHCSD
jgi:hypothetical protein